MVKVGKKWDKGAVYVGRGSPLGNLSPMASEDERDKVCDWYDLWLKNKIEDRDPAVLKELARLKALSERGDLLLGCYCAPKRCHAESIKRVLDSGEF